MPHVSPRSSARALLRAGGLLLAILFAGCGAADFNVEQPVPEQRVNGSPLPDLLAELFPMPLAIDIENQIKAMETGPIDSIVLASLRLSITPTGEGGGDTDDWSFLERADVYIESSADGSSLPRVKVAAVADPGTVRLLVFTPEPGVNLLPYVNEGATMSVSVTGTAPPDDVTYEGKAVFRVSPL